MKILRIFSYLLLVNFALLNFTAWAGTTGKIAGTVIDAETGEGLPGVNILIEGTTLGASTDLDGYFVILNISPGVYTLKALMIGYSITRITEVKVSIDFTTKLDFRLQTTLLETEEVVIIAERPIIQKDLTSTLSIINSKEIEVMPVEELADILQLQAGIVVGVDGAIHIRGGRASEVAYMIDGISVTDPFSGIIAVEVENPGIQELQVVSGTFNAEYGQAMSGIIDIATKEGGAKLTGQLSAYIGDYLSGHDETFLHIDHLEPLALANVQGSLSGPVPGLNNKFSFFITGRFYDSKGWLYGQRRFNPSDSSSFENWFEDRDDIGADGIPDTKDRGERDGSPTPGEPNVYLEETGDGVYTPMNPYQKISTQLKITYKVSSNIRLNYSLLWNKVNSREYNHLFKLNPDGNYQSFKQGYTHILIWNHTLSSKTFYTAKLANVFFDYKSYVYEDPYDSRYVDPKRLTDASQNAFKTGGTQMWHYYRNTNTLQGKVDLTSQVNKTNQVKIGMDLRIHKLNLHEFQIIRQGRETDPFVPKIPQLSSPANNQYQHDPVEASLYIQDKIEFNDMIVNAGLRYDYFDANGRVPLDFRDPDNAKYFYVRTAADDIIKVKENDYNKTQGEIIDVVDIRGNQWTYKYKDAEPVHQISPRIGIAYPITARGVIHFSYGHFFQIPTFEQLYHNPEFEVWPGGLGVRIGFSDYEANKMGNAELKPQQTISYEIGLQQQLTDDIGIDMTGFYKDIRNLLGIEIINTYAQDVYARYINRDYGNVRGFTLSFNKRRSNYISASVNYTYQVAEGNSSNPDAAYYDARNNKESEVQVVPLDWDQSQTLNFTVTLSEPDIWGVSIIGRLGSGLPYTPKVSNVGATFENSQRKPTQYNFDLRAHTEFKLFGLKYSIFLKIYNLFDHKNEIQVYSDTGRSGYTIESHGSVRGVNTLAEYLNRPDYYSEPRRVILGFSVGF